MDHILINDQHIGTLKNDFSEAFRNYCEDNNRLSLLL